MKCTRRKFLLGATFSTVLASMLKALELRLNPSKQDVAGGKNVSPTTPSTSVDLSLLLDSIAQVESGRDDSLVGKYGERSKYQIHYLVWQQHATREIRDEPSFIRFCNAIVADALAREHLHWLDVHMSHTTISETYHRPYALAWAWHGGLSSWKGQRSPARNHDFAQRVYNLYVERDRS